MQRPRDERAVGLRRRAGVGGATPAPEGHDQPGGTRHQQGYRQHPHQGVDAPRAGDEQHVIAIAGGQAGADLVVGLAGSGPVGRSPP